MSFGIISFTNRGRELQAKAQAGAQLNFTKIAIGDGQLSGQSISDLITLIHQVKLLTLNKFKTMPGGKAVIGGVLSNQDIVAGFWWRELGLFAMDPDLGEILYCYGNAGELAEYIPSPGGSQILEKQVDIVSIVGNASNISATIEQSLVYASAQALIDHENDTGAHGLAGKISHSLATAVNDFLIASGAGAFVKKTLAEVKTILGLGSAAYTNSNAYATAVQGTTADNTATNLTIHQADYTAHGIATHIADYVRQPGYGVTAGSANAYMLTLNPAPTAYVDGMGIVIKIHAANTGASTINVNGLGAKAIVDSKGNPMIAGKLRLNGTYSLKYNSTSGNFQLQGEGGEYGTAIAADVLTGKTIGTDEGIINGTMPIRGSEEYPGWRRISLYPDVLVPSTAGRIHGAIPVGAYLSEISGQGAGVMGVFCDDVNFIPAYIKKNISMFGLMGTGPEFGVGEKIPISRLGLETYPYLNVQGRGGITDGAPMDIDNYIYDSWYYSGYTLYKYSRETLLPIITNTSYQNSSYRLVETSMGFDNLGRIVLLVTSNDSPYVVRLNKADLQLYGGPSATEGNPFKVVGIDAPGTYFYAIRNEGLIKYDLAGNTIISTNISIPGGTNVSLSGIVSDGTYVYLSYYTSSDYTAHIRKYSCSNLAFQAQFDSPGGPTAEYRFSSGGIIIGNYLYFVNTTTNAVLVKMNLIDCSVVAVTGFNAVRRSLCKTPDGTNLIVSTGLFSLTADATSRILDQNLNVLQTYPHIGMFLRIDPDNPDIFYTADTLDNRGSSAGSMRLSKRASKLTLQ